MFDKKSILQSIQQPDDKLLMSKVLDQVSLCIKSYQIRNTEFLDPYQLSLCLKVLRQYPEIHFETFGGYEQAERRILLFIPNWMECEQVEYPLTLLKMSSTNKFENKLQHRDYLGALLHLGIKRELIGDIVVHADFAYVFVMDSIKEYIMQNLDKVRRDRMILTECSHSEFQFPEGKTKQIRASLHSLRLDCLIAAGFGLSRSNAANLVTAESVKVNWEMVNKPAHNVHFQDMISVKGYGRIQLENEYGESKKGRIHVSILKYL